MMSRRKRNPFTKICNLLKQRFDSTRSTSRSSNADTPFAGPVHAHPPPQLFILSSPRLSGLPASLPLTSQAILTPQPPSQIATLPLTIPLLPELPHFPQRSVYSGITPSQFTVSSPSYATPFPPNPLPQPPTSCPTPFSSLPQASRIPTPQFGEPTSFAGAHDFKLYDPQFNDFSLAGSGIDKLLKNSMPDAFHNSAARYPPPKCHFGTRRECIAKITDWALGNSDHPEPILWVRGPFGIGKSAVAQSCAEALHRQNKLAAALFLSRSNSDRDDPRRVFTSIAYQIATVCEPFSNIVDARIRKDPAFATKSLSAQFEELLIHPLSQMGNVSGGIEGHVVIIDGLDECRGSSEQCDIIDIIATSARNRTTPLRWLITSRPEEPIIQTMNSEAVSLTLVQLGLPVSRDSDHEILVYLEDEFTKIRERHRLPCSWPSEQALSLLVDRTAGLWIYAATIIRFITDENSFGPWEQLQIVLQFTKDISNKGGPDNPLAEMDFLYALIMQRVPSKIRIIVRKILLLNSFNFSPYVIAHILGLSEEQFRHSCAFIQSVVELQATDFMFLRFHFYHASFLDFMKDPTRSRDSCIYGDFLIEYRRERLDWLHQVCSRSTGHSNLILPSNSAPPEGWDRMEYYSDNLDCLWSFFSAPSHPFDLRTAFLLGKLRFRMMLRLTGDKRYITFEQVQHFRDNLPTELRDKIIREDQCPISRCMSTRSVWILGHEENETVAMRDTDGNLWLWNNQDPDSGLCFCGSEFKMNRREEM